MKLDEMKVQYERSRDGFSSESDFTVDEPKPTVKVDASGIVVKVGLCAAVLALAVVIRAFGGGKPEERVAETSTYASDTETQDQQSLGTLQYVDAGVSRKWSAPVQSLDIELLRDSQLLRFTAKNDAVTACMAGKVLSIEQDVQLGNSVRIQSDDDCETVYYGFDTVAVIQGAEVVEGDVLGTVTAGRSIYLRVFEKGAPQDPTAYVDLSLNRE